jgi:hypothetical protein
MTVTLAFTSAVSLLLSVIWRIFLLQPPALEAASVLLKRWKSISPQLIQRINAVPTPARKFRPVQLQILKLKKDASTLNICQWYYFTGALFYRIQFGENISKICKFILLIRP